LADRVVPPRGGHQMTVMRLKEKLKAHCGTSVPAMQLHLKDERGNPLAVMTDESKKLGFYSPQDGYILHIKDTDPMSASANGWLEDVSKVQKYEISDEDYNARENTYRKFKEEKLKDDPHWCIKKELALKRGEEWKDPEQDHDAQAAEVAGVEVGQRCEVAPGAKRGEVMFVGKDVEGLPLGWWVGIKYDEPVGKNDGAVKGKRHFQCLPGYGGMVRPANIKVGDFPEVDEFDELSDDEL